MSQHDNSQQDKVFVRNFSAVLGVLIVVAIGAYVLASTVTGGSKNATHADIKPISEVQVATPTKETVATATLPPAEEKAAPAEAAQTAPAEAAPAEKTTETTPVEKATEATATTEEAAKTSEPASETPPAGTPTAGGTVVATDLIAQKGYPCMACHQVDAKLVGPGFKEIAAKYKGDAQAATTLAGRVKAGGTGVWGQMPMPPNPTVTDEDMKTIVEWILALQ